MNYSELINAALLIRKNAYAPYSNFTVGAALLTSDGEIYSGCNIENAVLSPSVCAERCAMINAVSHGKREFRAIAIAGDSIDKEIPSIYCMPCGVCRQALAEFKNPNLEVISARTADDYHVYSLNELLPYMFSKGNV